MYRQQPKASKLLSAKWQEKEHAIHLAKLKSIKSAIKVQKPAEYAHLKSKPKKTQMLEGKFWSLRSSFTIKLSLRALSFKGSSDKM